MKKTRRFLALLLAVFMLVTSFQYNDLKVYAEEAPVVEENIEEPSVEEIPQEEPETPVQQEIPPVEEGSEEIINEEQPGVVEETPAEDSQEEELQAEEQEEEQEIVNDATFKLTLNANGGVFGNGKSTDVITYATTFISVTPEREGYMFTGWYLDSKCTNVCSNEWNLQSLVCDGYDEAAIRAAYNGKTIYAGWSADYHTVTYVFGTESGNNPEKNTGYYYDSQKNAKVKSYTVKVPTGKSVSDYAYRPNESGISNSDYHYIASGNFYTDQDRTQLYVYNYGDVLEKDITLYVGYERGAVLTIHSGSDDAYFTKEYLNDYEYTDSRVKTAYYTGKKNEQIWLSTVKSYVKHKDGKQKAAGLYKNADYSGNAIDFDMASSFSEDTELWVKWEGNDSATYLTLDPNGGYFQDRQDGSNVEKLDFEVTTNEKTYYGNSDFAIVNKDLHYGFLGWAKNKNATKPDYPHDLGLFGYFDIQIAVKGNTTLYAVWKKQYNLVTLHTCGGTLQNKYNTPLVLDDDGNYVGQTGKTNSLYLGGITATKEGYTFGGWYTEDDYINQVDANNNYSPGKDVDLYAKWLNTYKVSFDIGAGTSVAGENYSLSVQEGSSISTSGLSVPSNPIAQNTNQAFDGWYLDKALTQKVERNDIANAVVKADVTYYAKYSDCYTVTYDVNGGSFVGLSGTIYSVKVPKGEKIGGRYPNVESEEDGKTFAGWYIGDEEVTNVPEYVVTKDITLKAKYDECFTITFHSNQNGVNFDRENSDTVSVKVPKGEPYRYASASNSSSVIYGAPSIELQEINGKMPLAHQEVSETVIAFSTNPDGSGDHYYLGNAYHAIKTAASSYKYERQISDTGFIPTSDMDLYVVWDECIDVTLDGKGENINISNIDHDNIPNVTVSDDNKKIIVKTAKGTAFGDLLVRNNVIGVVNTSSFRYIMGWCTSSSCKTFVDEKQPLSADTTFYAKWYNGSYSGGDYTNYNKITFIAGDGYFCTAGNKSYGVNYGKEYSSLVVQCPIPLNADPDKAFIGWYTDAQCTNLYTVTPQYYVYGQSQVYIPDARITEGTCYVNVSKKIEKLYAGFGLANTVKLDANGGYFDADSNRLKNPTESQKSDTVIDVKENYKGYGICISEYSARVRRDGNKVFAGWYLDKECTQKAITSSKQVGKEFFVPKYSEVTLYAKWVDYQASTLSQNNPSTMTLKIGETYQLKLDVTPDDSHVRWVIDETYANGTQYNSAIKVSNTGLVTALAPGRTVIHAECNGICTSDISINVSNATVGTSITLDKSEINLFNGEETTVTAAVTPESSASNVKWTTSDKDIVAVEGFGDTATLTAGTKEGTAKVTATIGKVKSVMTVNVTKPIELDKKECTLTSMENVSVTLNTKLADSFKAQKKEITWTISDETALSNTSLHATGFYVTNAQFTVTPDLEETKVVTVTASITDGDKTYSDSCVITINPQLKTAAPVASIPSGTAVKKGTKISLSSDTYQSDIYYTVDGKDPINWDKELYMDPIVINEDTTIKAFAVKSKRKDSEIVEFHYTIDTDDWGDIKDDETKALFANDSSKVPSGMWYLVGDKTAYYTESDVIDFAKTYTGNAITFNDDICVYQGTTKLVENKDYTVSYKNNKLAAKNDAAKAPTVNIKGKGNYKNTVNFMFNINPASLSDASIASDKVVEIKSGSKTKLSSVKPTIMFAGKKLAEGKDYELLYYGYTPDNEVSENERIDAPSKEIVKEAGKKYAVVAIAKDGGNYVGAVPGMVVAECYDKNTEVAVSGLKVVDAKGKALSVEYTGEAYSVKTLFDNSNGNEAKAFVKDGKKVLEYNKDFVVYQVPNDEYASAGVHTIRVVGLNRALDETAIANKEKSYVGEKEFTFTITGKQLNKVKVAGLSTSVEYTGSAITLNDLFNKNDKTLDDTWTGVTLYNVNPATKEKVALEAGKDYTVSMENTGKVGKFTLKFTGINGYTGAIVKTIKVTSFNIKIDDGNLIYVNIADSKFTTQYTKSGAKPSVEVTFDGTVLKEGVDYTIAYKNNKAIVEDENALLALPASKRPTVTVTGKGNFAGSINRCFCITKTDISNAELVLKDVNYNEKGKKGYFLATPTITENGQKLAVGKNKDVEAIAKTDYIYTFAEDTWYDSVRCVYAGTKITADTEVPEGALIKVSVVVKCSEKSPYSSASNGTELVGYYRVIEKSKDLSQSKFKATLRNPSKFVYDDGNEVIPLKSEDIFVYYMEGKEKVEVSPNEYEIVSVTNNTKIGKATVVIRGKHSIFGYGGTKTITFNIGAKSL